MVEPGNAQTSPAPIEPVWRSNVTKATPPIERLMRRVEVTPGPLETACWLSTFHIDSGGYTQISVGGQDGAMLYSHRVAYEHFVGPIGDGLQLDHLCRVRHCVNPAHLEPVTALINTRRGIAPTIVMSKTDTCKRGHSLADAYVKPNGTRRCHVCQIDLQRARRSAR